MAGSRITRWAGDGLARAIRTHMKGNLDAAGKALVAEYRDILSDPYPPASSPGEPPHRRTGEGLGSIRHVPRDMGVDVVCDKKYMSYLDSGTGRIAPRPWKQLGFDRARDGIRRIMTRRLPGG
jgi:hypothetical protein